MIERLKLKRYPLLVWMLLFLVTTWAAGFAQKPEFEPDSKLKIKQPNYGQGAVRGLEDEDITLDRREKVNDFTGKKVRTDITPDFLLGASIPSGSETQVNTTTVNSQQNAAVAMDASGNYVVVWESDGTDASGFGIYGQRYNSGGATIGSEFLINSTTSGDQRFPAVAMDANGDFVIVWMDASLDGSGWGVYAQRYDNTGATNGSEFVVNSDATGHQRNPQVAMDQNGGFVVVWMDVALNGSSFAIEGRRFDNTGTAAGNDFQINSSAASYHGHPDVDMDAIGNFIAVWQSLGLDGSGQGIYGQRYDNTGATQGIEFAVNMTTAGNQQEPGVALDGSGNFVVTWTSFGQDGAAGGIYAQRFNSNGTTNGSEFIVNTTTTGSQDNSAVTSTTTGEFTVAWNSYGQDGSFAGVYLQAFDSAGDTSGVETLVNTRTADFQQFPAIAQYQSTNELVAAWQDGLRNSASTNDGDDYGIYLQRLTIETTAPLVANAGGDITVCAGQSAQIGGSPAASGGTAPYTYSWNPTGGLDNAAIANPTATPTATTSYIVTVTDANSQLAIDTVVVTVNPNPVADAGSDQSMAPGGSLQLGGSPTANGGLAPYSYAWSPAAGLDNATAANPNASPSSTTQYIVLVTDANGCTGSDTVTVTVTAGLVAHAGADTAFCAGGSAQIGGSPTASGGMAPYTYSWSPTAGLDNATIANPTAAPTSTTSYIVTITDANSETAVDTIDITINPNPVANAGSDQAILSGGSIQIGGSPTASGGIAPYTYSWSPATGLDDATIPNPTASPGNSTDYVVTVADANGCSDQDTVSVTVNPAGVTVELRDSQNNLITNSGASILYQPGSSGSFINFGDGSLDPNGFETASIADGTHRFRLTYQGATRTIQQAVTIGSIVRFQTTLAIVELRDSQDNPIQNSGAGITWQSGSSGSYVDFNDGFIDADGTERLEVLPLTHRFRLTYQGATQTIQQNVNTEPEVTFQTTLAVVELLDSEDEPIENSGATIQWQSGSSGSYVNFGDGTLNADGTEEMEVLPLTHRFRLTYQGATQTIQQNVNTEPEVTFQTTLAVVELFDSEDELIENSGATIQWQSGSSGSYVDFGDGELNADGTEEMEVLPVTHRFRLTYQGATQTMQQNVNNEPEVVFQTTLAVVELRDSGGSLIQNSGAGIAWQPGSSGSYVAFGDSLLNADGTEKVEVLPLTHRFRLTYNGATETKQQNVGTDSVVVFMATDPITTVELRDSNGSLIQNAGATILWQPGSSGAYVNFGDGLLDANGTESAQALPLTHRFRLTYLGATQTIQQNVSTNPIITFQTDLAVAELRDSNGNLIQNSGATVQIQPGSSGAYVAFGDGNLDADGTEKVEVLPLTHRFRLTYQGATQTMQRNVNTDSVVVFQTTLAVVELRDSQNNLIQNSGAGITWQSGSSGSYAAFGDGTLDADGTERLEVLPLTHRFRLTHQGATQTLRQNVKNDSVVAFQTTLAVVELRDSQNSLIPNSGATIQWQSGSSGSYEAFADGALDADGTERQEVLQLTHRFRLTYQGATQTMQQNVKNDSVMVFQTTLAVVELRDSGGNLILNSNAGIEWQSGAAGGYEAFGDSLIDADGTEKVEVLALSHRFRLKLSGETKTKLQNVGSDSIVVFTWDGAVLAKNGFAGTYSDGIPTEFALHSNYPNPFNPSTTVRFDLPKAAEVRLDIFNVLGQRVRSLVNTPMQAGHHSVQWDGRNNAGQHVVSGMYIYRLQAGLFVQTMKMTLMK